MWPRLCCALLGKMQHAKVVMRIGIGTVDLQCALITLRRFSDAIERRVDHAAIGQRFEMAWIQCHGFFAVGQSGRRVVLHHAHKAAFGVGFCVAGGDDDGAIEFLHGEFMAASARIRHAAPQIGARIARVDVYGLRKIRQRAGVLACLQMGKSAIVITALGQRRRR